MGMPGEIGVKQYCAAAGQASHSVWRKNDETNFLFFSSRRPLIDAALLTGIPSRQIR
jgi:hypothetical protein